jgi:hypothetical protein
MEFRWVAAITLWTFLIGPVLGPPAGSGPAHRRPESHAASSASTPLAHQR